MMRHQEGVHEVLLSKCCYYLLPPIPCCVLGPVEIAVSDVLADAPRLAPSMK